MSARTPNTAPGTARAQRFSVGAVISKTWKTFRAAPGLYITVSLIATLPAMALEILLPPTFQLRSDVVYVFSTLLSCAFEGAATYAACRSLSGSRAGVAECIEKGMKRYPSLAGLGLIMTLVLLAGNKLYVLPGLLALPFVAAAIPACVVENIGVWASLRRSFFLVKGCYAKIFGLIALYFAVMTMFLVFGILLSPSFLLGKDVESTLFIHLIYILPNALWLVMFSVMYIQLRSVKEGVTIRKLVDVFA